MTKSPDAFRTISEVAAWLEVPAHVLRFWESRFVQVKPLKRAGGRRYYRPTDMALLCGIKQLLHEDGLTIRGVQKLLREEGVRHVASLCPVETPGMSDAPVELATPDDNWAGRAPGARFDPAAPAEAMTNDDDPGDSDAGRTDAADPAGAVQAMSRASAAPHPAVLAALLNRDAAAYGRSGVDPAALLGRLRALAAAMDGHG